MLKPRNVGCMLLFREPKVQIVQTLSISKTFYYLMSFMTFFLSIMKMLANKQFTVLNYH